MTYQPETRDAFLARMQAAAAEQYAAARYWALGQAAADDCAWGVNESDMATVAARKAADLSRLERMARGAE